MATPPPPEPASDESNLGDSIGVDTSKPRPKDELTLEYLGYSCPMEYVNEYTPMEFEELVEQFAHYDVDKSGNLDLFEIQKVLHEMDLDFSVDAAKSFMDEIDEDGSGVLDFR